MTRTSSHLTLIIKIVLKFKSRRTPLIQLKSTHVPTDGFYVIVFTAGAYTLQENTTINGQIITAGELVVKAQDLCYEQLYNNWYCNQKPKHNAITVPTCTILHPQLEVNALIDFHTIPKSICTRTHKKNSYQDSLYL